MTPLAFTKFLQRCPKVRFISQTGLGIKAPGPQWPHQPHQPGLHGSHGPCQAKVGSTTASRTLSIYASAVEGSGQKSRKMPEELDELDELDVPLPSCQGKGKEKRKKKTALAALARLKAVANVGDSTSNSSLGCSLLAGFRHQEKVKDRAVFLVFYLFTDNFAEQNDSMSTC